MAVLTIRLSLTSDELLRFYRGEVQAVQARSLDGRTVQFPASVLREHVTSKGVYGTFRLHVDANERMVAFERIR